MATPPAGTPPVPKPAVAPPPSEPARPPPAPPTRPAAPTNPRLTYRGYHPFLFSTDEEVRALAKGKALDMREEARVLHLAKENYEKLRRWLNGENHKGTAKDYLEFTNLALAPPARARFIPRDRLHLEVERHEQVFNPDPLAGAGASGKLPSGIVFMGVTDLRDAVANFDLRPFIEAYVRRLSAQVPDYVFQFGEHHYWRTIGYTYADGHWDPRRFPVPKQVVDALGPIPRVAPAECVICGKVDEKISPTTDPKKPYAHRACLDSGAPALPKEAREEKRELDAKALNEAGKLKFRREPGA
ncbi:MAG: hypothetical protein ACYDCK_09995 [Thermoplasmatota archaeon]